MDIHVTKYNILRTEVFSNADRIAITLDYMEKNQPPMDPINTRVVRRQLQYVAERSEGSRQNWGIIISLSLRRGILGD